MVPYSFTQLQMYSKCPRKYRYRYLEKTPKFVTEETQLERGIKYHEEIAKKISSGTPIKDIMSDVGEKAKKTLETLEPVGIIKYNQWIERKVMFDESFLPTEDYNQAYFLGYCDYARHFSTKDGQHTLQVFDWKTGQTRGERKQITVYAAYFKTIVEKDLAKTDIRQQTPPIDIRGIFYYPDLKSISRFVINDQYIEKTFSEIKKDIEVIQNDDTFPQMRSKLCEYCVYQPICVTDL